MYEEFFGLRERPFAITPSADLFFHSAAHRRALAYLRRLVLAGERLIVLTGDIGAGKTTLLQTLIRDLPADRFVPATLVSTQLDDLELTRAVLLAFDAPSGAGSLESSRAALRAHLARLRSQGMQGLLVVDEAQNFSPGTLRYLTQLPELAAGDEPSLQAIVSGQPGLQALLAAAGAEAAGQEVFFCRLGPLTAADTASYVRHRLRVLGSGHGPSFSAAAFDQVQAATGGLPRLVNRLCDRVLVSAYVDQTRDIDSTRVARAAAELREELGESDEEAAVEEAAVGEAGLAEAAVEEAAIEASPAPAAETPVDAPAAEVSAIPPPAPQPLAHRPMVRVEGPRRKLPWAAFAAACLLVVVVVWLAADRPTPGVESRTARTAPAHTIGPAGGPSPPESAAPTLVAAPPAAIAASAPDTPAEPRPSPVRSREPQAPRPVAEPTDPRAALGLEPSPEPAVERAEPTPATPACSPAARALGLCP
jgi:type II secretory pathway predicted ATPase ExeA